jgi:hypothetical protein
MRFARSSMPGPGSRARHITGQKYTLLPRRENLSLDGNKALKVLLVAYSG